MKSGWPRRPLHNTLLRHVQSTEQRPAQTPHCSITPLYGNILCVQAVRRSVGPSMSCKAGQAALGIYTKRPSAVHVRWLYSVYSSLARQYYRLHPLVYEQYTRPDAALAAGNIHAETSRTRNFRVGTARNFSSTARNKKLHSTPGTLSDWLHENTFRTTKGSTFYFNY